MTCQSEVACDCGADAGTFHTAHPSGHAVTCALRSRQGGVAVGERDRVVNAVMALIVEHLQDARERSERWSVEELAEAIYEAEIERPGLRFVALLAEHGRYREALIECATIAGADVSGGVPTWPDVDVWAVQEVKQMRSDYEIASDEA